MNILENVPQALREPIADPTIIGNVVPQFAEGLSIDEVIRYINGAIRHQHRLGIDKDGHPLAEDKSNSFKATMKRVEIIERRGEGNFLYGRKARLHLEAKGSGGKMEDQSIDTEWIEYFGYDKANEVFSIALANTIKRIAEDNIGKEVIIRKAFITGVKTDKGGNSVRFCADITPVSEGASQGGSSSDSSSRGDSKPLASKEEVEKFIDDIKDDRDAGDLYEGLSSSHKREIPRIVIAGLAANNPIAYIKKGLANIDVEVSDSKLEKAIEHKEPDFELFFVIAEAAQ